MKNTAPIITIALLCGCASTSTRSVVDYFGPDETLVARETEKTSRKTLFMATQASVIDATMSRTNNVNIGGTNYTSVSQKVFGTRAYASDISTNSAGVIKAGGDAAGSVIGSALNKAVKP